MTRRLAALLAATMLATALLPGAAAAASPTSTLSKEDRALLAKAEAKGTETTIVLIAARKGEQGRRQRYRSAWRDGPVPRGSDRLYPRRSPDRQGQRRRRAQGRPGPGRRLSHPAPGSPGGRPRGCDRSDAVPGPERLDTPEQPLHADRGYRCSAVHRRPSDVGRSRRDRRHPRPGGHARPPCPSNYDYRSAEDRRLGHVYGPVYRRRPHLGTGRHGRHRSDVHRRHAPTGDLHRAVGRLVPRSAFQRARPAARRRGRQRRQPRRQPGRLEGLFGVLWDGADDAWVDADQNQSFADEQAMTDYKSIATSATSAPTTRRLRSPSGCRSSSRSTARTRSSTSASSRRHTAPTSPASSPRTGCSAAR